MAATCMYFQTRVQYIWSGGEFGGSKQRAKTCSVMLCRMAPRRGVACSDSRRQKLLSKGNKLPVCHFYTMILSRTLEDKKLRIPYKFVRNCGSELGDVAEVVVPDGHAWKMGLTRCHKKVWFDVGWQEFLEWHSISEGYLLVFMHRGFSTFTVHIFDQTACEIEYPRKDPSTDDNGQKSVFHHEDETEDDSFEALDCKRSQLMSRDLEKFVCQGETSKRNSSSSTQNLGTNDHVLLQKSPDLETFNDPKSVEATKKEHYEINADGKSSPPVSLHNETDDRTQAKPEPEPVAVEFMLGEEELEINAGGFAKASQRSKGAIRAARMYKPRSPSFMVLLRPYNMYNNIVIVPPGFARRYLSGAFKCLKLQVSDGRQWPVRVAALRHGSLRLGKGWHGFRMENNLEEGDVCVFELIQKNHAVLKVSIFRATEDDVPVKRSPYPQ